jgi:pyruvate formate lyase activating enzyme
MGNYLSYFNISWLSETDGPGKRLVLFLQGCHLNCTWCHSPHSQPKESPILFFDSLCKKCQRCKIACENDVHVFLADKHILQRNNCSQCGACIDACPQSSFYKPCGALVLPTRKAEVLSLFEIIKPQLEMLGDEGGITFSGGEPLLQFKVLALLAKMCKESGFHTALETSGIIPLLNIQEVSPFIDTWLVGMRLVTGPKTSQSVYLEKRTRNTLSFLTQNTNAEIIVRIPVIPGFTTTESYLTTARQIIQEYQIKKVELLPHNPESSHYYEAIDFPPQIEYDTAQADKIFKYVSDFFFIS